MTHDVPVVDPHDPVALRRFLDDSRELLAESADRRARQDIELAEMDARYAVAVRHLQDVGLLSRSYHPSSVPRALSDAELAEMDARYAVAKRRLQRVGLLPGYQRRGLGERLRAGIAAATS